MCQGIGIDETHMTSRRLLIKKASFIIMLIVINMKSVELRHGVYLMIIDEQVCAEAQSRRDDEHPCLCWLLVVAVGVVVVVVVVVAVVAVVVVVLVVVLELALTGRYFAQVVFFVCCFVFKIRSCVYDVWFCVDVWFCDMG